MSRTLYRINCGSDQPYEDSSGDCWLADQPFGANANWGYVGGQAVPREICLPMDDTQRPDLYRTERCGAEQYSFRLEDGSYTIRIHFAETFDCNFEPGRRSIDVRLGDRVLLQGFDPFTAAGAFARPAIIECHGCRPADELITLTFNARAPICGIEILTEDQAWPPEVRLVSAPVDAAQRRVSVPLPATSDATRLKLLFIGNSATFYWAIPESLRAMLEESCSHLRIEPHRSLHGGKSLQFHYTETPAPELIREGGFDFVVLQEQSNVQLEQPELLTEYARKFHEIILKSGARTILYAHPGQCHTADAQLTQILTTFDKLANELDATLVPACETLRLCIATRSELTFRNHDGVHLGMYGGYAVATTFHTVFTGKAPALPASILAGQVPVPAGIATDIHDCARQALATANAHCRLPLA